MKVSAQVFEDKEFENIVIKADSVVLLNNTVRIQYEYKTKNKLDAIDSPVWSWDVDNTNYKILSGPSHSTSSSFSIENGKTEYSEGETYTFQLSFSKEGTYTLPPMIAKTKSGRVLQSDSFKIRATRHFMSVLQSREDPLLVMETMVNKNRIKLGDSIECDIRLYFKAPITSLLSSSPLSIRHAYWKELDLPNGKNVEKVNYKGDLVKSVLWRKLLLIPIQAGKVVLDPMKFIATKSYRIRKSEVSINNGNKYVIQDSVISTNPIIIQVDSAQSLPLIEDVKIEKSNSAVSLGVVVDRSSSLLSKRDSISNSFIQMENEFINLFLNAQSTFDYSLTFFAGRPYYPSPKDLSNIQAVSPSNGNDGSAVYSAILASALRDGALAQNHSPYSILLLTDGADNKSRLSESTLTNILLKYRIRVDVIAFASRNDSIYSISNDSIHGRMIKNYMDFSDVERISKATNGLFLLIEDQSQLYSALCEVKEKLQKNEVPKQLPEKDFSPNQSLLNTLYKEIVLDSQTKF